MRNDKIFIMVLLLVTTIFCASCGDQKNNEVSNQVDPVSQKVMDDINLIGEVTLEDEELINNILEIYKTLTDNQKEQVVNYIDLLNAQDTIAQLKKEKELAEIAEKEKYLNIEREYYQVIRQAIAKLKAECKFPNTLEIKEIIYYNFTSGSIYISYSAENNLGNAINGYYNYGVGTGVGIDGTKYYKDMQDAAMGNKSKLPYKIGDNFYSESEEIGSDTLFVFIVDLDDFDNN